MKRLRDRINPKYVRICIYVIISAVIIFALCLFVYHGQGFFGKVWSVVKAVLGPIVFGALICYLLSPITNFLIRLLNGKEKEIKRWVRPVSVLLTILFIFLIIAGLMLLLGLFIYKGVTSISISDIGALIEKVRNELNQFSAGIQNMISGLKLPIDNLEGILSNALGSATGSISSILGSIPKAASTILFTIIFSIYFLLDGKRVGGYLKRICKALVKKERLQKLDQLIQDADRVFSGYLRGKILDALILGVVSSVAFLIAGVPYALEAGIFTGVVNLVPYVGNVISYVILILAYLVGGNFSQVWIGLIILTVILVADAYVLCPKLLNRSIMIHPLLVIVALIAGGAIGGLVGMLIAIPVVAFLKLQFDRYLKQREAMQDSAG